MFAVIALLVVHAKSGEGSRLGTELGADISLLHSIVPREIEGGVFRKKIIREYGSLSWMNQANGRQSCFSLYRSEPMNQGMTMQAVAPMRPLPSRWTQMCLA